MGRTTAVALALLLVLAGCSGVSLGGPRAEDPDDGGADAENPNTATVAGEAQNWTVTVERIVDGDTLEVEFPDGHTENVRLLGVDTPEVHVATSPDEFEGIPDTEAGREWLRDWGHRGSEFARTELRGEELTIATDPEADQRGGYGRLLVYVYHDGEDFNRKLLERGYARLYDSTFTKRDEYADVERRARENDVGLWGYDGDENLGGWVAPPERVPEVPTTDGRSVGVAAVPSGTAADAETTMPMRPRAAVRRLDRAVAGFGA